jgi:hypothetical protein
MASTPGVYLNTAQATQNLPDEHERLAFQEGHDADIPSNIAVDSKPENSVQDVESLQSKEQKEHDEPETNPQDLEVWWDGEDDPANPLNWSSRKKWSNLALVSFITFITYV